MTSTELNHIEELISQAEDKIKTNLKEAESICMHALAHCNKNTVTPEILYKAGLILSQCGKINQAEKIWQDAIQVANTKNDDLYKAFILHNIGTIKADLGNVVEATYLWEESLSIKEKLNDKKGIAATLNNLAWVSKLELDDKEETRLLLKAINIFTEFEMWTDIADNLIKLSISDEKNSLYYLVQSFYISTKYYVNPKDVLYVVTEIIRIIGINNKNAPIFASLNLLLNDSEDNQEVFKNSQELVIAIATANNIDQENISKWVQDNKLNDLTYLLSSVAKAFEEMTNGKDWLFDPSKL